MTCFLGIKTLSPEKSLRAPVLDLKRVKFRLSKPSSLRLTHRLPFSIIFSMSRSLRIEYADAWYHVMNRGRRDEDIFADNEDLETFLKLLREGAELWNVKIGAYCLMSNHYHLLVQTPQGNLSRFMRHLNGIYTQRYNRSHRSDGQLFRGRYKAILVEEDRYLLELIRYIHRNPLRAGMVDDIDQYLWSSHPGYLSAEKQWDWLHKEFILAMLGSDTRKKF